MSIETPSQYYAWKQHNPELWKRLCLCLLEDINEKRKINKNWNVEMEYYLQIECGRITGKENLNNVRYKPILTK